MWILHGWITYLSGVTSFGFLWKWKAYEFYGTNDQPPLPQSNPFHLTYHFAVTDIIIELNITKIQVHCIVSGFSTQWMLLIINIFNVFSLVKMYNNILNFESSHKRYSTDKNSSWNIINSMFADKINYQRFVQCGRRKRRVTISVWRRDIVTAQCHNCKIIWNIFSKQPFISKIKALFTNHK